MKKWDWVRGIILFGGMITKSEIGEEKVKKFRFPESKQDFQTINGLQDIKVRLKIHESHFQKFKVTQIYNLREIKDENVHKIVAVCRNCREQPSKLIWTKRMISDDTLKLKRFSNEHEHIITKSQIQSKMLKLKKKSLIDELQQFKTKNHLKMIPQKLMIDPQTGNVVYFPLFLFACSSEMISNFVQYGRVIFLHRFPFLIKKTGKSQIDYFVLVVSGLDQYANIIFYALSIVSVVSAEYVSETLFNLFQRAPINICETIFTENQAFFNEGVEIFKKKAKCQAVHLWDLLLQLKEHDQQKKQLMKKALKCSTNRQFSSSIAEYQRVRPDDSLKLEVFRKRSPRYCLSEIPAVFVGLSPPISHCDAIMQKILNKFPSQLEYNQFVFRFFDFLTHKIRRFPEKMVTKVEMPLLSDCRSVISQQAYNYVVTNLINSLQLNFTGIMESNQFKIGDQVVTIVQKQRVNDIIWKQKQRQGEFELKCSCCLKEKTGIPCSHIIRVCMQKGIRVSSQVASFWKPNHRQAIQEGMKREDERLVKFEHLSVQE